MQGLTKGEAKELSEKAGFRLKAFGWYYRKSALHPLSGLAGAPLVCRRFITRRSYFHRWKARCDKRRLPLSGEPDGLPPKLAKARLFTGVCRESKAGTERRPSPFSKKETPCSAADRGCGFQRSSYQEAGKQGSLFFRADIKRHKKRSKPAQKAHERQGKPCNLKTGSPRQIIGFDMKHIYLLGQKQYAFCAAGLSPKRRHYI
jgi:hypothetical protein